MAKLCLTLCNPMDCTPPGSSVHEISQASTLAWVAMSFSRGSSRHRDRSQVSCISRWILYHLSYQRSPLTTLQNSLNKNSNLVSYHSRYLQLSFGTYAELSPGPPVDTKVCRCSSPLETMVYSVFHIHTPGVQCTIEAVLQIPQEQGRF